MARPLPAPTIGDSLRRARRLRQMSQQALSERLGVSQRHLSFVECGKSRPGFELLRAWLDALDIEATARAGLFALAGYPLPPGQDPADAAQRARGPLGELDTLLQGHASLPTYVMDAAWNIVHANACGLWLARLLTPWADRLARGEPVSLLALLHHPQGIAARLLNREEVLPAIVSHARQDAARYPALAHDLALLEASLPVAAHAPRPPPANLLARYRTPLGDLAFVSVVSTPGWPGDIHAASWRVEQLVPADDTTRRVVEGWTNTTTTSTTPPAAGAAADASL